MYISMIKINFLLIGGYNKTKKSILENHSVPVLQMKLFCCDDCLSQEKQQVSAAGSICFAEFVHGLVQVKIVNQSSQVCAVAMNVYLHMCMAFCVRRTFCL